MSIALERNTSNPIQRSKFMQCVSSVYESPETKAFTSDRRFPVRGEREDSSSSSSIGRSSDVSEVSSDGEDSNEVQSSYKGPLDTLNALEQVLHIKRGISSFYNGKSKSFTSLADVSSASSVKELAKPEDPYTRKRKNLLAHNNLFDKNHNHQFQSNGRGTSKKPANCGRSTVVLGMTVKSSDMIHSGDSDLTASSHLHHLPPLHPQGKKYPSDGSLPPPPRRNSPWRSFSLSDLQCVAAASPNI